MPQINLGLNDPGASEEMSFESVDSRRRRWTTAYPINFPGASDSGLLQTDGAMFPSLVADPVQVKLNSKNVLCQQEMARAAI